MFPYINMKFFVIQEIIYFIIDCSYTIKNLWFDWTETIQKCMITSINNAVRIVFKKTHTTRKTNYCSGPIAESAKTAAISHLLWRVFGLLLYIRSITAFYMPATIVLVFCGVLQRRANDPLQYVFLFAASWTAAIDL